MISLGDTKISGLYLGETKIQRAYLGEDLIYEGTKKPSRLPDGYTELKYIENTDMLSGINTGVNGYYARTRVTMDLEPLSDNISNTCAICATNRILYSSAAGYYYLYLISNINLGLTARIGVTKNVGTLPQSGRCIIDFNPKGKYVGVDGANVTMSVPTMTKSFGSIYLLKPPTQYAGGSASYGLPCKLYSAQVYYNEALYRDFVPCIDPNGDIGLFDLVNSAFYKDAFTGGVGFSAGPAV